jgi:Secretion system C-terminal sorting domain
MKRGYYVLALLFQFNGSIFGGSGLWEYYLNTNFANYGNYAGGNAFSGSLASNLNLNSSTLYIDLSGIKTWQDNTDNISSGTIHYRVYKSGDAPGGFSSQGLPQFGGPFGNNKEWQNNSNLDLLENLSETGTYNVEVYFTASGTWSGGSYELRSPSGSAFHTASFSVSTALPVVFNKFYVQNIASTNLLTWQTHSETNHSRYEVERSSNAQNWFSISKVKADLSRSSSKTYEYLDIAPLLGRNYYRIKQVDLDGTTSYSEIRSVHLNPEKDKLIVFPNPSTDRVIKIEYFSKTNMIDQVQVYNQVGQTIYSKEVKANEVDESINLSTFSQGLYFISLRDSAGQILEVQKLMLR